MKIAIIGSRTFSNLALVHAYVQQLHQEDIVISGGAAGPDTEAEQAAQPFKQTRPMCSLSLVSERFLALNFSH